MNSVSIWVGFTIKAEVGQSQQRKGFARLMQPRKVFVQLILASVEASQIIYSTIG
jgi:hypothetical protein